jgi:hypothetical protein
MNFTDDHLAAIQQAIASLPTPLDQNRALVAATLYAQEADAALAKGERPPEGDALRKAVNEAVEGALAKAEDGAPKKRRSLVGQVAVGAVTGAAAGAAGSTAKRLGTAYGLPATMRASTPGQRRGVSDLIVTTQLTSSPKRHELWRKATKKLEAGGGMTGREVFTMRHGAAKVIAALPSRRSVKYGAAAGAAAGAGIYVGKRLFGGSKAEKAAAGGALAKGEDGAPKKRRSLVGQVAVGAATGAAAGAAGSTAKRLAVSQGLPAISMRGSSRDERRALSSILSAGQVLSSPLRHKVWMASTEDLLARGQYEARDRVANVIAALPSRRSVKYGAAAGAAAGAGIYVGKRIFGGRSAEKAAAGGALAKALSSLPLAQREHAIDLIEAGREETLKKMFPGVLAAAKGLWTAANVAGTGMAVRDLWRAGSAAAGRMAGSAAGAARGAAMGASRAGRAGYAGIRAGMRGSPRVYSAAKGKWGARGFDAGAKLRGAGNFAMAHGGRAASEAAEGVVSRYGPRAMRAGQAALSNRGVQIGAAGVAAGGVGSSMGYQSGRQDERNSNPFIRNQQRRKAV